MAASMIFRPAAAVAAARGPPAPGIANGDPRLAVDHAGMELELGGRRRVGVLDGIRACLAHGEGDLQRLPIVGAVGAQPPAHEPPGIRQHARIGRQAQVQLARDLGVLERDDRHVIARAASRNEFVERAPADLLRRARHTDDLAERLDALRKPDAGPFDEPIGVEHEHLTGPQQHLDLDAGPVRGPPRAAGRGQLDRRGADSSDDERRQMPGAGQVTRSGVGVKHGIGGGRHRGVGHGLHEAIDELECAPRPVVFQGVGVQAVRNWPISAAARMPWPTTSPMRHAQLPPGELEDVIPVPAHLVGRRKVAGRRRHAGELDEPRRQEAAL